MGIWMPSHVFNPLMPFNFAQTCPKNHQRGKRFGELLLIKLLTFSFCLIFTRRHSFLPKWEVKERREHKIISPVRRCIVNEEWILYEMPTIRLFFESAILIRTWRTKRIQSTFCRWSIIYRDINFSHNKEQYRFILWSITPIIVMS